MKAVIYLAVSSALLLLSACKREAEQIQIPVETPEEKLQIIWQKRIVPEPSSRYYTISMNPCLIDSQVVFGTEYYFENKVAPILFLDTISGVIENTWSDYGYGTALYTGNSTAQWDKFLLLSTQRSIDCINLEEKKTEWSVSIPINGPRIHVYKGDVFTPRLSADDKTATIMKSPVNRKDFVDVFSFTPNGPHNPDFESLGFGQLSNGDDVVVWKSRNWGYGQFGTDIFAYNLSADTLLWRNTDLQENSNVNPLQIENERVYGLVQKHAFCMDLRDGSLIWKRKLASLTPQEDMIGFDGEDFHLEDQLMLVKGNHGKIIFLFKSSGYLHKEANGLPGGLRDRMTYFEGKLFFAAEGNLVIANVATGQQLLNQSQEDQFQNIQTKILIDPNRRVMYFHDGRYAYCVKIPNV